MNGYRSLTCRVCGRDFPASRFDALTCSSTCRQRLHRGQEFAYLAGLPKNKQDSERAMHRYHDKERATAKENMADTRGFRELKRESRRHFAEWELERAFAEFLGREQLKNLRKKKEQEEDQQQQRQRMLAGVLKLFDQHQRIDRSAEAIATFLNMPRHYPIEVVRELLTELQS